jgi:hypothetical protein
VVKNRSTTAVTNSYGILAADAGTVLVNGNNIAGNGGKGYALYNGNAAGTEPSTGAPIDATGNFWGTTGTPAEAETVIVASPASDVEGVGGPVTFSPVAGAAPTVPKVPALLPDAAPVGEIVNPGGGEAVEAGVAIEPVVLTEDDYGVASVSLKVNGTTVAARSVAPYVFTWKPTAAQIGTTVSIEAKVTDSAGHVTTSTVTVPAVESAAEVAADEAGQVAAQEAAKEAAEKATAAKEAVEVAAATKAGEAALKAAEEKAEAASKEAKEAKELAEKAGKSPVSTGKVSKDTSKGTARLSVIVPSPGQLVVTGSGIKKVSGHPTAPGQVQVLIAAKGKALATLDKTGKVTVKVQIAFTGHDGTKQKATTTVTLVKK